MMTPTILHHADVLDDKRIAVYQLLMQITQQGGWYLAGGTGLAIQLGHRDSIDLDFFTARDFSTQELLDQCIALCGDNYQMLCTMHKPLTLRIEIDGVKCSFIHYQYPLISGVVKGDYSDIASIADIGCMKLSAIQHRSVHKDYVDLYYIFQHITIPELIVLYHNKYGSYVQDSILIQYLTYFDDIHEHEKVIYLEPSMSRKKIMQGLQKIVKKFYMTSVFF